MAHRALAVAVVLLALIAAGECLLCNVCIPPLSGDKPAQQMAIKWRANISRTFPNKAESDFQVCSQFDQTKEQAQANCPWNDDGVVCLDIKHNQWQALSCGIVPADADLVCSTHDGAYICQCQGSLCNADSQVKEWWAQAKAAPTGGQGAATLTALLVIALAAAR